MGIHDLGGSTQLESLFKLERGDMAPGPLGSLGNQTYTVKEGGTARASAGGMSSLHRFLKNLWTNLQFRFSGKAAEVRAQGEDLCQARSNSFRVGTFLGCMTARKDDIKSRGMASELLGTLGELSKGDLSQLLGAKESLTFYLNELTYPDLRALRDGVLSDPDAMAFVMDQVGRKNHYKARAVLDQVVDALDKRLARTVQEPLAEIAVLLRTTPINGEKLRECLLELHRSPAMDRFDSYVQSLPQDLLTDLQTLAEQEQMGACIDALATKEVDNLEVYNVLDRIRQSSGAVAQARAQREASINNSKPHIDSLLDGLRAAQLDDTKALAGVAEKLALLSDLSQGDLTKLRDGWDFVSSYLKELNSMDLIMLSNGALGSRFGPDLILDLIPPGKLHSQADNLFMQIRADYDMQLRNKVEWPFDAFAAAVSDSPVNGQMLHAALIRLSEGVDLNALQETGPGVKGVLDSYFRTLAKEKLEPLLVLAKQEKEDPTKQKKMDECLMALAEVKSDQAEHARTMLNLVYQSLVDSQEERQPWLNSPRSTHR